MILIEIVYQVIGIFDNMVMTYTRYCTVSHYNKTKIIKAIKEQFLCTSRQRPYHIEHTSSRPITEALQFRVSNPIANQAMLSPVSTWMGDRLGTLGAVGILFHAEMLL